MAMKKNENVINSCKIWSIGSYFSNSDKAEDFDKLLNGTDFTSIPDLVIADEYVHYSFKEIQQGVIDEFQAITTFTDNCCKKVLAEKSNDLLYILNDKIEFNSNLDASSWSYERCYKKDGELFALRECKDIIKNTLNKDLNI